jgi:hypothetical protein
MPIFGGLLENTYMTTTKKNLPTEVQNITKRIHNYHQQVTVQGHDNEKNNAGIKTLYKPLQPLISTQNSKPLKKIIKQRTKKNKS